MSLDLYLCPAVMRCLSLSLLEWPQRGLMETQDFHHHPIVIKLFPLQSQWRPPRSQNSHSHHAVTGRTPFPQVANFSPNISIITLYAHSLNTSIKRQGQAEQIKKHNPTCAGFKKLTSNIKIQASKSKGWKKKYHTNNNQRKARVAILITDKVDSRVKTITRDREGYYVMIKGSIHTEDIAILSMYAPKRSANYMKKKLLEVEETDQSTITSICLSTINRITRQKISKDIELQQHHQTTGSK